MKRIQLFNEAWHGPSDTIKLKNPFKRFKKPYPANSTNPNDPYNEEEWDDVEYIDDSSVAFFEERVRNGEWYFENNRIGIRGIDKVFENFIFKVVNYDLREYKKEKKEGTKYVYRIVDAIHVTSPALDYDIVLHENSMRSVQVNWEKKRAKFLELEKTINYIQAL